MFGPIFGFEKVGLALRVQKQSLQGQNSGLIRVGLVVLIWPHKYNVLTITATSMLKMFFQ